MDDKLFIHQWWEYYPDCDVIPEFKALRNKRGDEASSRLLWYLRFMYDPEHEYISKLPRQGREELLVDYCGIKKSDKDSKLFQAAEKWYVENYMSKAKRVVRGMWDKMEEAEEVVRKSIIYAPGDIEAYDKDTKALLSLRRTLENAEAVMKSEIKQGTSKIYGKDIIVGAADDGSLYQ